MNRESFDMNGAHYERISKRRARTLFESRHPIGVCPSNCNPRYTFWFYTTLYEIERNGYDWESWESFDRWLNKYMYYNCNSELGHYVKFYSCDIKNDK